MKIRYSLVTALLLSSMSVLAAPDRTASPFFTVTTAPVHAPLRIGATVVPRQVVTLKAQAPGRVMYLAGDEGTRVEPRQMLVGLDNKILLAKRRAAWATLARYMAGLQHAGINLQQSYYGRSPASNGMGMGLPSLFDRFFTGPFASMMGMGNTAFDRRVRMSGARKGYESAQSAVVQAQSQLDMIDTQLRNKTAIAPFRAVILKKFIEKGEAVQPGQPLVRIADVSNLQLRTDIPARYLTGMRRGTLIPVALDSGQRVRARISRIFPAADPMRHTVTIKLDLPRGVAAAPGMYGVLELSPPAQHVPRLPVIPLSAIQWRGSLPSVFVLNNSLRLELRIIRPGERYGNMMAVLSGLRPGERVVVRPTNQMQSGQTITPGFGSLLNR